MGSRNAIPVDLGWCSSGIYPHDSELGLLEREEHGFPAMGIEMNVGSLPMHIVFSRRSIR